MAWDIPALRARIQAAGEARSQAGLAYFNQNILRTQLPQDVYDYYAEPVPQVDRRSVVEQGADVGTFTGTLPDGTEVVDGIPVPGPVGVRSIPRGTPLPGGVVGTILTNPIEIAQDPARPELIYDTPYRWECCCGGR